MIAASQSAEKVQTVPISAILVKAYLINRAETGVRSDHLGVQKLLAALRPSSPARLCYRRSAEQQIDASLLGIDTAHVSSRLYNSICFIKRGHNKMRLGGTPIVPQLIAFLLSRPFCGHDLCCREECYWPLVDLRGAGWLLDTGGLKHDITKTM
jgi:hypothetical protein